MRNWRKISHKSKGRKEAESTFREMGGINMEKQSPILRIWELGKNEHDRLITAVILAILGTLGGMVPYFAAAHIIVMLLDGEQALSGYVTWLAAAFCGYAVRTILYNLALSISHKATFSVLKTIREQMLAKLPRLPLGTVMDTSSGKMKQIIVDQVDGMETTLAHLFPEMTANITAPVLTVIYLFVLDWRLALLSLAVFPVGFVFMMMVMGNYEKDYEGAVKATNEMSSTIIEYIGGIEVIKAFNQGKTSYARFTDRVLANAQYYYDWMKRSQLGMSMTFALFPAQLLTVLPVGWIFYQHGSLSSATFLTVIILSLGVAAPIVAAFNFVDTLAQVGTTVAQIDEILKAEEQEHLETRVTFASHDIEVNHVSFGYHEEKEILHDVSLSIPEKQMTALVGPSGSGKSTIAKLIAGFWDVTDGSITMGGHDLKEIPLAQLYDQVAFVSQDNYLFDESIRENIRMGRQSATDQEVEAAAHAAGCDSFIGALEHGYDTMVGGGGAHLSGGERQRIAIARAMLKDAPIVILDEATAYIDPENEAVIQRAVAELVENKTVIVIAHRLSTITGADNIVVIQDGKIAAQGKHEQLLKESALYKDMWQAHIGAKDGDEV